MTMRGSADHVRMENGIGLRNVVGLELELRYGLTLEI